MLLFDLGADMSVDTIIDLPFIKQTKLELWLDPDRYLSHVLKKEFEVVYDETKLSNPLHATQDNAATAVSEEAGIIAAFKGTAKRAVEPLNSILHNTARGSVGLSSEA